MAATPPPGHRPPIPDENEELAPCSHQIRARHRRIWGCTTRLRREAARPASPVDGAERPRPPKSAREWSREPAPPPSSRAARAPTARSGGGATEGSGGEGQQRLGFAVPGAARERRDGAFFLARQKALTGVLLLGGASTSYLSVVNYLGRPALTLCPPCIQF
jgi:hypothetical protein